MERVDKKHRVKKPPVYPLNLGDWIPQKDVRKLIWNKLNWFDKLMVWAAHGVTNNFDSVIVSERAASGGYLEVLKYLYNNRFKIHPDICNIAARRNHLDVLKWGHENKFEVDATQWYGTTNSEIREWLLSLYVPDFWTGPVILPDSDSEL